jgi:hypothetical protein
VGQLEFIDAELPFRRLGPLEELYPPDMAHRTLSAVTTPVLNGPIPTDHQNIKHA